MKNLIALVAIVLCVAGLRNAAAYKVDSKKHI